MLKLLVLCASIGVLGITPPSRIPNHNGAPTFTADVAPILYRRCTSCRSDRSVAPFSLIGYENARKYASTILAVTAAGTMPPWKAANNYGEFRNVAALSSAEKSLLRRWVDGGAPKGDPNLEPVANQAKDGWLLGKPDLVVTTKRPVKIPSEGRDFYRDYLIDPGIKKPTWVRAIEFRPSGKNTVHHRSEEHTSELQSRRDLV